MRFLTGVASGFLGAMNKEMDTNRKEREEWRKMLFKHYTENVIPSYQKLKLTAMERATKAQQYGAMFQNQDLGNLVANTGDAATIMKLYQMTGGPAGGMTNGLGGTTRVNGNAESDNLEGGPTPLQSLVGSVDQNHFLSQMGTPKSIPSGPGLMAQAPKEQNFWNKMMGVPDRAAIGRSVANDIGSLYGVSGDEIQNMGRGLMNPHIPALPVNQANLPKMKNPSIEKRLAEWRTYKDDARDPRAFQEALTKYEQTGDNKYLEEAAAQIMTYDEKMRVRGKYNKSGSGSDASARWYAVWGPALRAAKFDAENAYNKAKAEGKSDREAKKAYDDAHNNYMGKVNRQRMFQNDIYGSFGGNTPDTSGVRDD